MSALFEYVLVVSKKKKQNPEITYRFPHAEDSHRKEAAEAEVIPQAAPHFCFPEGSGSSVPKEEETFSFTLTVGDGTRRFGYCRRFVPSKDLSECYCLISELSSFSLFSALLDIVQERRKTSSSAVFSFLKSVLAQPLPAPGRTLQVATFSTSGAQPDRYELELPLGNEFLLDYVSYRSLFRHGSLKSVVALYENLLLENRLVLVSKKLSRLSSVALAATGLLHPLTWQYVFIPVLPQSLLSYCCAPMPFVVGVLASSLPRVHRMGDAMEDYVEVDLDRGEITRQPPTHHILSDARRQQLLHALRCITSACDRDDQAFDLHVAHCFTQLLADLCGHYPAHLTASQFDEAAFLAAVPDPADKPCVELIIRSQMWSEFRGTRQQLLRTTHKLPEDCALLRFKRQPWTPDQLWVECTLCAKRLSSGVRLRRGKAYCVDCFESNTLGAVSSRFKQFTRSVKRRIGTSQERAPPKGSSAPPSTMRPSLRRWASRGSVKDDAKPVPVSPRRLSHQSSVPVIEESQLPSISRAPPPLRKDAASTSRLPDPLRAPRGGGGGGGKGPRGGGTLGLSTPRSNGTSPAPPPPAPSSMSSRVAMWEERKNA